MVRDGWIERKEFWIKKAEFGTWICGKDKKNQTKQ